MNSSQLAARRFTHQTTRFNLVNALRCAQAAELAYQSKKTVYTKLKKSWCFDRCQYFEKGDTQAFLAISSNFLLLSFRGTQSFLDWQTNLNIRLVKFSIGKVHRGFRFGFHRVWKSLKEALVEFNKQKRRIWVTGHSLGGALATLTADQLSALNMDVGGLYTFGQPRVGDRNFAKQFDQKIKHRSWRFVNNEDVVTHLPPSQIGFRHIGTVRYFDHQGRLHRNNLKWKSFLDAINSAASRSLEYYKEFQRQYPNSMEDHHIKKNMSSQEKTLTFKKYINR